MRVAADVDNAIDHGAPSWRNRAALRWEKRRMRARLGPCLALDWVETPALVIFDIMLPSNEIPDCAWLPGELTMRANLRPSPRRPLVVADLYISPTVVVFFEGSHVSVTNDARCRPNVTYVVTAIYQDYVDLLLDVRGDTKRVKYVARTALAHLPQTVEVLSTHHPASGFTRMAVPPLGSAKQAWLRDGRACVPQPSELNRALEHADVVLATARRAAPHASGALLNECIGDGVHARLCGSMAARSTNRLRQLDMFDALDAATGDVTLERRAAAHLALYRPASPTQTYVVLVAYSADGALVAFVGGDLISLPLIATEHRSGAPRGAAIEATAAFGRHLFPDERHVPVLAHDGADARVVALPLLHLTPLELRTTFSPWVEPGDLGCGPLARPVE